MADKVTLSMVDASGEPTRSQWHITDITAVNYVAELALADAIRSTIEAISLCNEMSLAASLTWHSAPGTPPTNVFAQRELAIKVFYTDGTTNRKYNMTIPGPNLSALTLVGDQVVLADSGIMAAFVTAFEAGAKSYDGNTITVTSANVVGRNS